MENLVKVKLDEGRKTRASTVFAKSNLSLPGAIRLFVNRSIENDEIPLSLLMPRDSEMDSKGLAALRKMQMIAALNGNSEMTLDDINAEISEARASR